jgi:hypothetical protein
VKKDEQRAGTGPVIADPQTFNVQLVHSRHPILSPFESLALGGAPAIVRLVGVDRAGAVGVHGAAHCEEVPELVAAALDA